jgi:UDPglucose 6-dehydrogenase
VLSGRLQGEGATVVAYDPIAEEEARKLLTNVEFAESELDAVRDADAVVLVTEWPQFKDLDFTAVAEAMRGDVVIDGRNALDPETVRAAGLKYEGVGRGGDRDISPEPVGEVAL